MVDEISEKYQKLFLYLNVNVRYRDQLTQKYESVLSAFEGDSLLDEIQVFHSVRESTVNLQEASSKLEHQLRIKLDRELKQNG